MTTCNTLYINRDTWKALGNLIVAREQTPMYAVEGRQWISLRLDGSNFSKVNMNRKTLPTENLLEDTKWVASSPLEGVTKQPISVLSGVVAGCDRFLLTSASLGV